MGGTYADAPQEIKDAVESLIRTYGSDPALLAGALVASMSRAIVVATATEREANARLADGHDAFVHPGTHIAAAIRKRGEA